IAAVYGIPPERSCFLGSSETSISIATSSEFKGCVVKNSIMNRGGQFSNVHFAFDGATLALSCHGGIGDTAAAVSISGHPVATHAAVISPPTEQEFSGGVELQPVTRQFAQDL
ncbi:hypothetical protein CYMTET_22992, partial [Cymbomonas tetramitiformis]